MNKKSKKPKPLTKDQRNARRREKYAKAKPSPAETKTPTPDGKIGDVSPPVPAMGDGYAAHVQAKMGKMEAHYNRIDANRNETAEEIACGSARVHAYHDIAVDFAAQLTRDKSAGRTVIVVF